MGSQERSVFIIIAISSGLISFLIFFFLYFLYKNQRKLAKTQKDLIKAEYQSSELERKKIALELHNDIIPQLSGLKLRLSLIENSDPLINQECIPNLEKSINEIRELSKRISPMNIYEDNYLTSIREYIKSSGIEQQMHVEIIEKDVVEMDSSKHHMIYRILQEIVQNTIKHSKATELKMEFSRDGNTFLIRSADNGIGFLIKKGIKLNGLGLKSIHYIISELGGELHKAGPEHKGTKYNFKIPLNSEE